MMRGASVASLSFKETQETDAREPYHQIQKSEKNLVRDPKFKAAPQKFFYSIFFIYLFVFATEGGCVILHRGAE